MISTTKVTLRTKPLAKAKSSLYLDFYPAISDPSASGRTTRREFLRLYLFTKPKSPVERAHNKETKALAERIRAQRLLAIQQGQYPFLAKKVQPIDLLDYFRALGEQRKAQQAPNYVQLWKNVYLKLASFTQGSCPLQRVDKPFCEEFKRFLTSHGLAANTAHTYFIIFKSVIKAAYEEGLLEDNPAGKVRGIKPMGKQRAFLTLEELKQLRETNCDLPLLARAALFSALTGLRFSDIQQLCWGDVHHDQAVGHYLRFSQQKTAGVETLPMAAPAVTLLGERQTAT